MNLRSDVAGVEPPAGSDGDPAQARLDLVRLHLATLYDRAAGDRLLRAFGSAGAVFERRREQLARQGLSPAVLRRLADPDLARLAEHELDVAAREEITLLCRGSVEYPAPLRRGPPQPLVLFARGRWRPAGGLWLTVGVVGSRRPTPYGLRQARRFAGEMAQCGVTVVSGLARGVDAEAHRGAIDGGGTTVAVLGSGLGRVYPPENRRLAARIAAGETGLVLTPFPFAASPRAFHFPLRNATISGLSRLLLVVEAGERSGTLITVDHALDEGKPVFAVPGRVDQPESRGCLRLLRDGAAPAVEPADVLVGLLAAGDLAETARRTLGRHALAGTERSGDSENSRNRAGESPLVREVLGALGTEDGLSADTLAARLRAEPAALVRALGELEARGVVRRLPGGGFALA